MFVNYFMVAVRSMLKFKGYTAINLLGMVLGISSTILAVLYANFEMSYENWLADSERIYRVESYYHFPGGSNMTAPAVGGPTIEAMRNYFPGIEDVTREINLLDTSVMIGEKSFQDNISLVDPNYLDFFGLDLIQGDRETALGNVNSALLSEAMAIKYFGRTDAVGETLTLAGIKEMRVVGIFRELPRNTHLSLDIIARYDRQLINGLFGVAELDLVWNNPSFQSYFKLFDATSIVEIEDGLDDFTNANYAHPRRTTTPTEYVNFGVRPISEIHLESPHPFEIKPTGSIGMVIGAVSLSALILLIATFNYVSLATATATLRDREISVRKVYGARNHNIATQFIGEALILSVFATFAAIVVVDLVAPFITAFFNLEPDSLSLGADSTGMALSLVIGPLAGLLSGLYPAFYLGRIRPARVLGSSRSEGRATSVLRSLLVTIQFAIAVGLMISVSIIAQQSNFVTEVDMGYDREGTSVLRTPSLAMQQSVTTLIQQIKASPGITAVSASSHVPSDGRTNAVSVEFAEYLGEEALSASFTAVEPDFFQLYGIELVAGRLLSDEYATDKISRQTPDPQNWVVNIVINETAVGFLGHSAAEDVLGMQFRIHNSGWGQSKIEVTVVGVVPDMQFGSAFDNTRPEFFLDRPDHFFAISVKSGRSNAETREAVQAIWNRILPDEPFQFTALDEMVEAQYEVVSRQKLSLFVLTALAVTVATLGLFGMATFSIERRTREIGIRKILGARVGDIVRMLLLQLSRPVIAANLLAWPVVYYFMSDWLQGFVLRIDMPLMPFLASALGLTVIAWATVAFHATRVARANPVHALRYE